MLSGRGEVEAGEVMGRYFNMPEAGSRWQIGKLGRFNWAVVGRTGALRLFFRHDVAKYATVVESFAGGQKPQSLIEQPFPL